MSEISELAERLRVVVRQLKRRGQALGGVDAPTPTETSVLSWLHDQGPMTPSALSAAHHVRPQTMGQALDLLGTKGWIKRSPHPTDRRQVLIALTPAGHKALTKGRRLRQAWLVAEFSRLPTRDRRIIADALTILERMLPTETQP